MIFLLYIIYVFSTTFNRDIPLVCKWNSGSDNYDYLLQLKISFMYILFTFFLMYILHYITRIYVSNIHFLV